MVEAYIDSTVLEKFFHDKPNDIFNLTERDKSWLSFSSFFKSGSDIFLSRNAKLFINTLTTGRNGTNLKLYDEEELTDISNKQSVFFVPDESNLAQRLSNTGLFLGKTSTYLDDWERLSLVNKPKNLNVLINENDLENWENLNDYLEKITDVLVYDRYILNDNSLIESNLMKLISVFTRENRINLTIVCKHEKTTRYDNILNSIQESFRDSLHSISIVATPVNSTFHDRVIITNYVRFNSGDSFNYFKSNGDVITNGTGLQIIPLVIHENDKKTDSLLREINSIINRTKDQPNPKRFFFGDISKNYFINLAVK